MKLTKTIFAMAAALATTGYAGFSTPFPLDMNSGMRVARETESITYSPTWREGAPSDATVVVSVDGTTLTTATEEGSVAWSPATNGTYMLTHKVMSQGAQHGETLTATFKVVGPKVTDVVAKQRYPWNGLVDITCKVTGINGMGGEFFSVAAVMPESGGARKVSHFWVVRNGTNSTDRTVSANGSYRLLWDASADLGQVSYDNMVMRVTVKTRNMVQLWEGGPYWADTNIGAENPEDYGYYFWWGATVGYKRENDKWVVTDGTSSYFSGSFDSDNAPTYGKGITTLKNEGWITEDGILAPEHDAAHVHWGGNWRMPTSQELSDLNSKCDWTWRMMNGVVGYVVKGKGAYASASIFLPCAGGGVGTSLDHAGSYGFYWSSVPYSVSYYYDAWYLYFRSSNHDSDYSNRYYGRSVRPVQGFTN